MRIKANETYLNLTGQINEQTTNTFPNVTLELLAYRSFSTAYRKVTLISISLQPLR